MWGLLAFPSAEPNRAHEPTLRNREVCALEKRRGNVDEFEERQNSSATGIEIIWFEYPISVAIALPCGTEKCTEHPESMPQLWQQYLGTYPLCQAIE